MRYLPLSPADRQAMLARIGVDSVDALFESIPKALRLGGTCGLAAARGRVGSRARYGADGGSKYGGLKRAVLRWLRRI